MDKNGFGATKIKKNMRIAPKKTKIKLNKESNQKKKAERHNEIQ